MNLIHIATVGGAPAPVLQTLRQIHSPQKLVFLASEDTKTTALELSRSTHPSLDPTIIVTPDHQNFAETFSSFRRQLIAQLPEIKTQPSQFLCNITGGTKPMSSALMMLATEWNLPMVYVGGTLRDKEGTGTVKDGSETILAQVNPWQMLGIAQMSRVALLWERGSFQEAGDLLASTGQSLNSPIWQSLAHAAWGYAQRLRFNFSDAQNHFREARNLLPDEHPLQDALGEARKICSTLKKSKHPGQGDPELLLRELLGNAQICFEQHRYEDAAARFYRAIEMWAQIRLHQQTGGLYWNGRLSKNATPELIPDSLKSAAYLELIREPGPYPFRLTLTNIILTLEALGFSPVSRLAEDIKSGRNHSRFLAATEKRNTSVLAHGTDPVTRERFLEMTTIIAELFSDFPEGIPDQILPPSFEEGWLVEVGAASPAMEI